MTRLLLKLSKTSGRKPTPINTTRFLFKGKPFALKKLNSFGKVGPSIHCFFSKENIAEAWSDGVVAFLKLWRESLPGTPELNFDLSSNAAFNELKQSILEFLHGESRAPRSSMIPLYKLKQAMDN